MAWLTNYDERYVGGIYHHYPGLFDAYSIPNSTFRISEGVAAYGVLNSPFATSHYGKDVYSFGILGPGKYQISASEFLWDTSIDFQNGGYINSLSVIDSVGIYVDTSISASPDITFSVNEPSDFYVEIDGFLEQYSVTYTKIHELNTPTVWNFPSYTGNLTAGSTLDASVTYDDNGNSDGIYKTHWYLDDLLQSTSEVFYLGPEDSGKAVSVAFDLTDDAGYFEASPQYTLGTMYS